jgi:hypothetical protein
MPKKSIADDALMARGQIIYMLELARGSSHISSTRSPPTLKSAIAEVLGEFCEAHGSQSLGILVELLARDIEQRGNRAAAIAVRCLARDLAGEIKVAPSMDRIERVLGLPEKNGRSRVDRPGHATGN